MDRLQKIRDMMKAEQEKVYYLNTQPDPGLALPIILNNIRILMALEYDEIKKNTQ